MEKARFVVTLHRMTDDGMEIIWTAEVTEGDTLRLSNDGAGLSVLEAHVAQGPLT